MISTKQFVGLLLLRKPRALFQLHPCDNFLRNSSYCTFLSRYFFLLPRLLVGMGKGGFYAVARGRSVGVYSSWNECSSQVKGFPNARFKKFSTNEEAEDFISKNGELILPGIHGSSSSVATTSVNSGSLKRSASTTLESTAVKKNCIETATTVRSVGKAEPAKPAGLKNISTSKGLVFLDSIPSSSHSTRLISTSANLGKRSFKVTEERVINKRSKQEDANSNMDLSSFDVDQEGYVIVFTDGACRSNGRRGAKAGIGVWFGENHPLNISEPVIGRQTNNTAEIQAAERAILQAKEHGINKLNVKTDSQFTINCVTQWMSNWKRKNWKLSNGESVKNREDLEKLDKAMNAMEIKWSYVAGHKGHHGNEEADKLAVAGAAKG